MEILNKLRFDEGDTLYVMETPDGIEPTAYRPDFAAQMDVAEEIMPENRDLLRKLALQLMNEPVWILKEAVIAIHKRQRTEHGRGAGIRYLGLLESAILKRRYIFYTAPVADRYRNLLPLTLTEFQGITRLKTAKIQLHCWSACSPFVSMAGKPAARRMICTRVL